MLVIDAGAYILAVLRGRRFSARRSRSSHGVHRQLGQIAWERRRRNQWVVSKAARLPRCHGRATADTRPPAPTSRGIGHFPYAFFLLILVAVVAQLVLSFTKFGRDLYTVGGNLEAARLSGIKVGRAIIISYAISGFCAGLSALVLVSRMTTSQENLGIGIELSAIAAAIIGGVSLQGGIGNVIGPVIGAFLMGVILIGLNLVGITTYAQPVLTGTILLGAVYYDRVLVLRRARPAEAGL